MSTDQHDFADTRADYLARIEAVFSRFGWAVTDEFKDQYVHVSTVYHLTNGLVALAEENDRLRQALGIDGGRDEALAWRSQARTVSTAMSDRVSCARCGTSLWWWKAYWWRGDPKTPYCSRRCAQPQYDGRGDGSGR